MSSEGDASRADIFGTRPQLIGLLGAEATGKSTLARDLARTLDAELVTEALRDFVTAHGRAPRRDEQAAVMREQLAREAEALGRARDSDKAWVVCDPCVLMTPAYSIAYFGDDSLLVAGLEHQREYRIVLKCLPDIPWTPDPGQRDGPALRERVETVLSDLTRAHGLRLHSLSGTASERLAQALSLLGGG
ncbi:MAG: ATP-binding protein [Candidatus Nanopelagicales bacterium]|nr:ATP-binding protein [Candidatus Nanopelagicales bacterium]